MREALLWLAHHMVELIACLSVLTQGHPSALEFSDTEKDRKPWNKKLWALIT